MRHGTGDSWEKDIKDRDSRDGSACDYYVPDAAIAWGLPEFVSVGPGSFRKTDRRLQSGWKRI